MSVAMTPQYEDNEPTLKLFIDLCDILGSELP